MVSEPSDVVGQQYGYQFNVWTFEKGICHDMIDTVNYSETCVKRPLKNRQNKDIKGDSYPNDKYVLSERAL